MYLTVTPDPVLDRIFAIDEWLPGMPMVAKTQTISVGGKGLDASVALRCLGIESVALCFLAGETGRLLLDLVNSYGIIASPVWVSGETRCAYIIAEQLTARHSHVFSGGISINAYQLSQYMVEFQAQLSNAQWVLTGGVFPDSLPATFYQDLTARAHKAGVPILIDAHSKYIHSALSARPTVIKMNLKEFEQTFNHHANATEDLLQTGWEIFFRYQPGALVITMGADGLAALTPLGLFLARPPSLTVRNAAGAGDAASAAIAWRRSLGDDWPMTLRWAAAASAAVVLTDGTADLLLEDVQALLPQISVEHIGGARSDA